MNNSTPAPEQVALTDTEAGVLAEFQQAARDNQQQALGALRLIIRQRGLAGNWSLEGNALVKQ